MRVDLAALADELDAEALRNSVGRELFTNPAKTLAERMSDSAVVLAGDNPATLALARHGAAALLRLAGEVVAAAGLGDVLAAVSGGRRGAARGRIAVPRRRDRRTATAPHAYIRVDHRHRTTSGDGTRRTDSTTSR